MTIHDRKAGKIIQKYVCVVVVCVVCVSVCV